MIPAVPTVLDQPERARDLGIPRRLGDQAVLSTLVDQHLPRTPALRRGPFDQAAIRSDPLGLEPQSTAGCREHPLLEVPRSDQRHPPSQRLDQLPVEQKPSRARRKKRGRLETDRIFRLEADQAVKDLPQSSSYSPPNGVTVSSR